MTSKIIETVLIEFIGGPKDGGISRIKKPYRPLIILNSIFRSDVKYIYEFDNDPKNCDEPFKFRFKAYQKK